MTNNPTLDALINVLGGISAVLNVVGVIALVWLKTQYKKVLADHTHRLDVQFATREAELRLKTETELTVLKANLQRTAAETQRRFDAVYAKREELLNHLHRELIVALNLTREATRPGNLEIGAELAASFGRLHAAMEEAAIYFPEDFCERWHQHASNLRETLDRFFSARRLRTPNLQQDLQENRQTYNEHLTAFKAMRSELRTEIRKWLGTE